MRRPNVLFITLDQFRGDALSCAGHPVVRTPNLDALASAGVRLARHYSQAAPCSPGRAALYTSTYQMTNRVVANGTPLDDRFDNLARVARRAGYEPALFGYTDQGVDPRLVDDPADPRLSTYEGVLPGFDAVLDLREDVHEWRHWMAVEHGIDTTSARQALCSEDRRPTALSISTFLTERLLDWLREAQETATATGEPWFAHASYLRPHPPFVAAGDFATMYDPMQCGEPIAAGTDRDPLHELALQVPSLAAPADPAAMGAIRAQYFGMISEVDAQLGRLWAFLRDAGAWNDTVVVVTSDHGEQLGDQGLLHKLGHFESSYHVLGIVRDPRRAQAHGRSSSGSPRTSTSCRRCVSSSGWPCQGSATAFRSRRSWTASSRLRGVMPRTTSSTGVTCCSPASRSTTRGTVASTTPTSPCAGRPTGPSCTSAMAPRVATTWRPTRRGARWSPTRRSCSPRPPRCSTGAPATSTAR